MKIPVYTEDDENQFLGFISEDNTSWQAQTIFGYIIARTSTRGEAEEVLHKRGAQYLKGVWQYYDKDERDWFPCVIKNAYENKVTLIRTNDLGLQDPEFYKFVELEYPDENMLVKSS